MQEYEAVIKHVGDIFVFEVVVVGPDDFGNPASRPRKILCGLRRDWAVFNYGVDDPVHGLSSYQPAAQ
jgi:hypothetical protein